MRIKHLLLAGVILTINLFSQGVERIDWGYFFSNALYTKWSPLGTPLPGTPASIGLKKQFGEFVGTTTSTGIDTTYTGSVFITGPNYSQYQKYVYTTKYSQNERITYKVNFQVKKGAGYWRRRRCMLFTNSKKHPSIPCYLTVNS
ncbi:MAG: hypothetical protein IPG53_10615 [Ignavibacteriales bacterium]|nr:hypothetical protein [Ignavibacteriales bacterium]